MGLGDGLKKLRSKVGAKVADAVDDVLGDQPDSAAGAGDNHPKKPGSISLLELDQISAGFPSELRSRQDESAP